LDGFEEAAGSDPNDSESVPENVPRFTKREIGYIVVIGALVAGIVTLLLFYRRKK